MKYDVHYFIKKYDVHYFIKKFSDIPDSRWTTGRYTFKNKHCAIGHCRKFQEAQALRYLFRGKFAKGPISSPVPINDGIDQFEFNGKRPHYTKYEMETLAQDAVLLGSTPKERILNALELIKAGVYI